MNVVEYYRQKVLSKKETLREAISELSDLINDLILRCMKKYTIEKPDDIFYNLQANKIGSKYQLLENILSIEVYFNPKCKEKDYIKAAAFLVFCDKKYPIINGKILFSESSMVHLKCKDEFKEFIDNVVTENSKNFYDCIILKDEIDPISSLIQSIKDFKWNEDHYPIKDENHDT